MCLRHYGCTLELPLSSCLLAPLEVVDSILPSPLNCHSLKPSSSLPFLFYPKPHVSVLPKSRNLNVAKMERATKSQKQNSK